MLAISTSRHADERAECLLVGMDRKWPTYAQNVEMTQRGHFDGGERQIRFYAATGMSTARAEVVARPQERLLASCGSILVRRPPALVPAQHQAAGRPLGLHLIKL